MTSALAPALSPRRGEHSPRFPKIYITGLRMLIRKTGNKRKPFPLLGERIKVRADDKLLIPLKMKECNL